jgi:hypothetical protein
MAYAKPSYTHTQATAATIWTIEHGLGVAEPAVNVFIPVNGVDTAIVPKEIRVVDTNTVQITFSTAKAGAAILQ